MMKISNKPSSAKGSKRSGSSKSESTTNETGLLYTTHFSDGFIAQNSAVMDSSSWLYQEVDLIDSSRKLLGDFDFVCRITENVTLKKLFPSAVRCSERDIPSGTSILFEVTSMGGHLAMTKEDGKTKKTKVAHKLSFYETVFTRCRSLVPSALPDVDLAQSIVIFVYNGADYVDVSRNFTSSSFATGVVHLPMAFAVQWKNSIEIAKRDQEIANRDQEIAKRDEEIAQLRKILEKQSK